MPKVTDLINSLGIAEDGISTVYPETFTSDLEAAYAEDMGIPEAKIGVLTQELAEARAEIEALKAHNYDLIVSSAVEDAPADNPNADDEDVDDSEDDDDVKSIDGLFK